MFLIATPTIHPSIRPAVCLSGSHLTGGKGSLLTYDSTIWTNPTAQMEANRNEGQKLRHDMQPDEVFELKDSNHCFLHS
ncbi:uncharacterized protein Dvir_GJ26938 [Drosophila virilis]|uniref:Uncharacterized protein n=1 Tax=Drosophila virilis TaxID=7244 RepID=A0A0Q9W312_DROVI|nr:uncharacterized protein Dvir_GJ26938 [Drosophila virilis]